ncbi:rifin [Plasmodium falciparum RAJ116]|uniref:Rifin n=1 Tax=Plasmodium falciparum RAJ116 TaxID=580058 RepID=A0A0L0D0W0_PLAFA|nr:rifin [Plasmodium falciparum RAJ116]
MKCAQNLGGIVAPSSGVLAGIAEGALIVWKPGALDAAIAAALKVNDAMISAAANAAGLQAGIDALIEELKTLTIYKGDAKLLGSIIGSKNNTALTMISNIINERKSELCSFNAHSSLDGMCTKLKISLRIVESNGRTPLLPENTAIPQKVNAILTEARGAADAAAKSARETVTTGITEKETVLFEAGFNSSISSINAAIIAIVVIILVMVIIYKILRYRRKKKMKKKLQYIKLLEE